MPDAREATLHPARHSQSDAYRPFDSIARVAFEVQLLAHHPNPERVSWKRAKLAMLHAADSLREACGQLTAPISLGPIAKFRHINTIEFFTGRECPEATLSPLRNGFAIKLKRSSCDERARASIAHEIGHTFFYDLNRPRPERILSSSDLRVACQKEEDICWAFAREILVPRSLLTKELASRGSPELDIALIECVARRFRVSEEMAAVRLLWDRFGFDSAMCIVATSDRLPTHAPNVRKYRGRSLRSPRGRQAEIIEAVARKIAVEGPPTLDDILKKENVRFELKVNRKPYGRRVLAVLAFDQREVAAIARRFARDFCFNRLPPNAGRISA